METYDADTLQRWTCRDLQVLAQRLHITRKKQKKQVLVDAILHALAQERLTADPVPEHQQEVLHNDRDDDVAEHPRLQDDRVHEPALDQENPHNDPCEDLERGDREEEGREQDGEQGKEQDREQENPDNGLCEDLERGETAQCREQDREQDGEHDREEPHDGLSREEELRDDLEEHHYGLVREEDVPMPDCPGHDEGVEEQVLACVEEGLFDQDTVAQTPRPLRVQELGQATHLEQHVDQALGQATQIDQRVERALEQATHCEQHVEQSTLCEQHVEQAEVPEQHVEQALDQATHFERHVERALEQATHFEQHAEQALELSTHCEQHTEQVQVPEQHVEQVPIAEQHAQPVEQVPQVSQHQLQHVEHTAGQEAQAVEQVPRMHVAGQKQSPVRLHATAPCPQERTLLAQAPCNKECADGAETTRACAQVPLRIDADVFGRPVYVYQHPFKRPFAVKRPL
jgi:hypothetical protein